MATEVLPAVLPAAVDTVPPALLPGSNRPRRLPLLVANLVTDMAATQAMLPAWPLLALLVPRAWVFLLHHRACLLCTMVPAVLRPRLRLLRMGLLLR